jgi:hypothetical protein
MKQMKIHLGNVSQDALALNLYFHEAQPQDLNGGYLAPMSTVNASRENN